MEFFLMANPKGGPTNIFDLMVPFLLVFFIMGLFVWLPGRKEQKAREAMLKGLRKGDEIITHGGIMGKVTKIKGDYVEIKVDESNNTKITFLRSAVMRVNPKKAKG